MPLGSAIGSGLGIINDFNIKEIVKNASVPVIVDAGVGTASDACIAMELVATGFNEHSDSVRKAILMAGAMKNAVHARRQAYLAGRIEKDTGSASSPTSGIITDDRPVFINHLDLEKSKKRVYQTNL